MGQHWFVYDASYAYTGPTIGTSATYDAAGNRLMSSTDAAGNTLSYTYNNDGTVSTVTDPKGNTTTYAYDALGRVTSVTGGGLSVAYGYSGTYLTDLTAIRRNGAQSDYSFTYNHLGQTASIAAVGQTLASYTYDDYDRLSRLAYGGGGADNVLYVYDDLDRIAAVMYTNGAMLPIAKYYYVYDATGRLFSVTDDQGHATYYLYDLVGRLCEIQCTEGTGAEKVLASRLNYAYDEFNRLTGYTVSGKGIPAYTATATYGDATKGQNPDAVYAWNTGNSNLEYTYDDLGRAVSRTLTTYGDVPVTTQYDYKDGAGDNTTTTMVNELTNGIYGEYTYSYDANGNIRSIMDYTTGVALSIHYTYDAHNQLIREDSQVENKTHTWTYDTHGNITSKKTYAYTREETLGTPESAVSYTYYNAVPDILINYNGQYFNYDSIGNPTSYRGMSMTWTQGRRLATLSKDGLTASYTYDVNGIRTSKTINGTTTQYTVLDGRLLGLLVPNQYRLVFLLDNAGKVYGFKYYKYVSSTDTYNYNQTYYYEFNLQGDVIAIYNASGTLTATYKYDAWGKLLGVYNSSGNAITSSTSLGIINPIRYRGYLYDTETGFYYLQSRYYDPEVGRFLNADGYVNANGDFIGYNMYAYCSNNPVNCSDPTGERLERYEIDGFGGAAPILVNNNDIPTVASFFSPSTNTISGQFQDGIFRGSGSLTGGYSEFNWRLDDKIKSSGSQDGWVGGFGKASVGNANGKIGIGNDNLSVSQKGVADGLVATAQAGLHYQDGFGVGAKAKASVLSGRTTTEFNIFGWQVELGVSGDLLSVGAEATIGIFPTDDGGKKLDVAYGASYGLYGWGFVARVKVPG